MASYSTHSFDLADLLGQLPFLGNVDPAGKRVLVRADFNVPLDENGALVDDGRLRAVLPTINYLLDRGASVVVAGHLRDPLAAGGPPDARLSFAPLARRLSRLWEVDVAFVPEVVGPVAVRAARDLPPGGVLLLENLRFHPGETAADPDFARDLASLADMYVNDAFGVCLRDHASMTMVTRFLRPCVAGFALRAELAALNRALTNPARPMAAVIGGRNIEAKLPVLAKLLGRADYVLLGGLMGDAFSRLIFGGGVDHLGLSAGTRAEMESLIHHGRDYKAKLFLPMDAVALAPGMAAAAAAIMPVPLLAPEMRSEDIGPATRLWFWEVLSLARTIIWNGPMGAFEIPAFARGTAMVTRALAECQGVTLAGGVDTSAAILKMSDRSQVSFLSTGGSAFLQALAGQPLVALEALLEQRDDSGAV